MLPPDDSDSIVVIGGLRVAPGDRIGSYVYRRVVGQGGMAHVLLASDPDGRPVALKVLKSNRVGSGYQRFLREFRALSRLRHPNVIRVDALGSLHGHPFIAMEYVEGHDLHYAIHSFRALPPDERWRRCEEILVDLCRALAYIHRRGLIHRDLKPSNVLLDHDRHAKLTDFGIVKDLHPDSDAAISTTLVGTWAYASAEQIQGLPIDHRSDLYSLGVILFAMLTGRRPFVARDLAGYLELHRSHTPPAPREFDPAVPVHLDEICRRLLRKHPRDRFRSAQEILYRLEQLEPEIDTAESAVWESPLVGRAAEEELLRARASALTRGQGGLVVIEGGQGSGKTRLLDVVSHQVELMGITTHRVRAASRDGPASLVLRLAASVGAHLHGRGGERLADAVRALTEEADEKTGSTGDPGEDRRGADPRRGQARERLAEALVDAMALLSEDVPQVVVVDDLHNAQLAAIDALAWLVRRFAQTEGRPVLFVLAWQPDRVGTRLSTLRDGGWTGVSPEIVRLRPLDAEAVEDLVQSLVGPGRHAEVLAERLLRETEGNPLFLVGYVQSLMNHGVLARSTGGWRIVADLDELATGHMDVPPEVRQVVHARLDTVGERERPLLDALAVNGREIALDVLLDVLDLDEEDAADRLQPLLADGLLRQRTSGPEVFLDFAHAKFGDVVYRDLDPERRAETHRRIAAALESRYQHAPAAAEVVGEHYRRAGDAGKALHYLVAAAARAASRSQFVEAAELVGRAQLVEDAARMDLPADECVAVKHVLLRVRADVLFHRSEWAEARDVLEQAVALAKDIPEDASTLRTKIHHARALRVLGELDQAEKVVRESLGRARELHDRETVAEGLLVLAGVAWARGDLDGCESSAQEGLVLATGPTLAGARAHLLLALTAVQASRGQLASAAAGLVDAQELFRGLRMRPARALALSNLAEVLLFQGDLAGAWEYAADALQEAEEVGNRLGEGAAHGIRGLAALHAGMFEDARTEIEAALAAARSLGVQAELAVPAWQMARLDLEEGDLDGALTNLDTAAAASRLGDPEHYGPAIEALRAQVNACIGATEAARSLLVRTEARVGELPVMRRAQVLLDVAATWRLLGERDLALARLNDALSLTSGRGIRLLYLDARLLEETLIESPSDRTRVRADIEARASELSATLPSTWQESFRKRLGLPR